MDKLAAFWMAAFGLSDGSTLRKRLYEKAPFLLIEKSFFHENMYRVAPVQPTDEQEANTEANRAVDMVFDVEVGKFSTRSDEIQQLADRAEQLEWLQRDLCQQLADFERIEDSLFADIQSQLHLT